jgi:N-acetylmuramoyl-L-alanine amidase
MTMRRRPLSRPSPNFDARKLPVDMVVLHYTGMTGGALERLRDPAAKVSAHYLVEEDGTTYALVPEDKRAWHAGVASWQGEADINSCSIGIELDNPGHDHGYRDFPPAQMGALVTLLRAIVKRHDISIARVLGHSDVAPARKQDPGERFDWEGLAAAGFGLWPDQPMEGDWPLLKHGQRSDAVADLQDRLAALGYGIAVDGDYGDETAAVVTAFQRHWRRTQVDGIADAQTQACLAGLLSQFLDA